MATGCDPHGAHNPGSHEGGLSYGWPHSDRQGWQHACLFAAHNARNMATAGKISGLVIQALRYLGKEHVDSRDISILDDQLDNAARQELMEDIRYVPAWIADIIRSLATR